MAVPTGAAPVVMMIHHAVADLGFLLADGGTDRGDNAARFVPYDHMSVDAAHPRKSLCRVCIPAGKGQDPCRTYRML